MKHDKLKKILAALTVGIGVACSLMALTPADLTFIEPTDTIGNSRVTINSNDWLLANALGGVSGTNGVTLNGTNTWTGTNTFTTIVVTNFNWDGLDNYFDKRSNNTAAASTTQDLVTVEVDETFLVESAAPASDIAGMGQLWVSNNVPNDLYFVQDDGTVVGPLAAADGTHSEVTIVTNNSVQYLSIGASQVVTIDQVDMTADVTGEIPDANVADNITASSYLPLAGGVMAGDIDNDDIADVVNVPIIKFGEIAASDGDVATEGQLWVRSDTPNVIVFTDDAGTDTVLGSGGGGGGGGTIQDASTLGLQLVDTGLVAWTVGKEIGTNSVDLQSVRSAAAMINLGEQCSILGGADNKIIEGVLASVICGGHQNDITDATDEYEFIGGGRNNTIDESSESFIGGGLSGVIQGGGDNNVICGGSGTSINGSGSWNFCGSGSSINLDSSGNWNVIVGGNNNNITGAAQRSAIVGGDGNDIIADYCFIGGGEDNEINNSLADWSAVLGGSGNLVAADYSSICGGRLNTILGSGANTYNTIGGGISCSISASSDNCFAFGNDCDVTAGDECVVLGAEARAGHNGCFVWSDSSATAFASTGVDQFLIEADGGVGIGTNAPDTQLHVNGIITGDPVYSTAYYDGAAEDFDVDVTPATITNYTGNFSVNTSFADATGIMTIDNEGTYDVSFAISYIGNGASVQSWHLFTNGVDSVFGCQRKTANATDVGSASFRAIIPNCAASDTMTIRVEIDSGSGTITLEDGQFIATRVN